MIAVSTLAAPPLADPIELGPRDFARPRGAGALRRIGDVMPEVLARYGLPARPQGQRTEPPRRLDAAPTIGRRQSERMLTAQEKGPPCDGGPKVARQLAPHDGG